MDKYEYREVILKKLRDIEVDIGVIGISSMIADVFLLLIIFILLSK